MPTLDLKEKMQEQNERRSAAELKKRVMPMERVKKQPSTSQVNNAGAIDEIFSDCQIENVNVGNFERARPIKLDIIKIVSGIFFILALIFLVFYIFKDKQPAETSEEKTAGWYAVKLANGETYYGEVMDTATDPVVVKNVYYNYDQIDNKGTSTEKKAVSGNLRLVKRGKESHEPTGSMEIVRSQVLLFEALKEDSKVLRAILDYEK